MNELADTLITSSAESAYEAELLCDRCAQLDFVSLSDIRRFDHRELFNHGVNVQDLGPISEWDFMCRICVFFNSIKYDTRRDTSEQSKDFWHLRAVSSLSFFEEYDPHWVFRQYYALLGVFNGPIPRYDGSNTSPLRWNVPSCRLFVPIQSGPSKMAASHELRYVDPQKVGYQHIRNWIKQDKHRALYNSGQCDVEKMSTTQGIKLIDCDSLEVVHAKGMEYVALSYVWGRRASSLHQSLNEAPQVVQDAVVVAKELNYRYLWVDQYCIDQSDADEKHSQIAQMDKIYSEADLTIIAAAGTDADYGLPGVSVRARASLDVQLNDFILRCTGTYPHLLVKQSKWHSRGWTLQEALLSTKHLFFTEEQVFFECPCFSVCESVNTDYAWAPQHRFILHTNDVSRDHFTQDISKYLDDSQFKGKRLEDFDRLVANYRRRELSHQEDTLNAILGVLRVFARATSPVFHFYGIPTTRDLGDDRKIHQYLAAALAWKDVEGRQLLPHLPSWTWAAWSTSSDSPGPRYPTNLWDAKETWDRRDGYPSASFGFLDERKAVLTPISHWSYTQLAVAAGAPSLPSLCIQSYVITVPVTFEGRSEAAAGVDGVESERPARPYRAVDDSLSEPVCVDDWAARELFLSTGTVKEVDALVLSGYKTYPEDALSWDRTGERWPSAPRKPDDMKWDGQELDLMLIRYVDESTVRRISVFRLSVPRLSPFNLKLRQRRVVHKLV